jgi:hypothetical protein
MVRVAVVRQPVALVPVTVYVVVVTGDTTTDAPVIPPGIHEYVPEPLAVNVVGEPAQIVVAEEEATVIDQAFKFVVVARAYTPNKVELPACVTVPNVVVPVVALFPSFAHCVPSQRATANEGKFVMPAFTQG